MTFLKGKKTYIIAVLMVLIGLVRLVSGDIGITDFFNSPDMLLMLNALGLAALRSGMSAPQQ